MNVAGQHAHVCIIGGGVAGLAAAQQLLREGVEDILLIEAQERLGGRVHTVKKGDSIIEVGAHWIHGEEGNVVYEWAAEKGLVSDEASNVQTGYGSTKFLRQDGSVVPESVIDAFVMVSAKIAESSKEDLKTYPRSLGHYYKEKFSPLNKWGELGDELLEWEGRFQNCINGSDDWHDVSGSGLPHYKECPGNPTVNFKHRGYQNLIDDLQEKIPKSRILLKTAVKHIEWGASPGCRVTLESGPSVTADHVIFTPSLGVLKATATQLFSPSLPSKKMMAIEGLGFGVVGKIFLQFPHQWWEAECDGFSILPNLQAIPKITKENWEYGLLGFYQVYQQPTMLCVWMTGPTARSVEGTEEGEVGQRCVAFLRRLLSHTYTNIPDATYCNRSTWGSNSWTRGSYSFRSIQSETMAVHAEDLAHPLLDSKNSPVLCFAGEATHPHFYSTVHGALESGRREATRLLHHIKRVGMSKYSKDREKYSVVVVGAGAAGVGAARELAHNGIKSVLILEGNDRVGGRINTVETSCGGAVDLGAQWIHGQDGNAIYKFAAARGLLHDRLSQDGRGTFLTENGMPVSEDIVRQVCEVMDEADDECIEFYHGKEHLGDLQQLSVGDVFRRKFFDYLNGCKEDSPELRKLKEALFYWHLRWQRIDNACDSLQKLSASCWGQYIYCEGNDNMNPKDGFMSIMKALLKETPVEVKLNKEVSCIDYAQQVKTERGVYVRPDGTTFPVIVKCTDGVEYEAQHVIVTPSIGYLKAHLDLFSPPLPKELHQTISSRGYGTIDKIFLEYDAPWWWKDCDGIQLVWTNRIPDFERTAPHTKHIDGSSEEMRQYWVRAISGFDPVFHHPALLCGWVGGAEAEYMEGLSLHQLATDCTNLLRTFLPNMDIPHPKNVYRSQWKSDKFFCGSYSYHSVGCLCCADLPGQQLDTPVTAHTKDGTRVPVLVVAGEANSSKHYSTVHGALLNGVQQARHYITTYNKLYGNVGSIKSKI